MEYSGAAHQRFFHLVRHLMQTQKITSHQIYRGRKEEKIQVFIEVDSLSIEEAEENLQFLSSILEQKFERAWKCLPSASLPDAYNIVTLPYERLA